MSWSGRVPNIKTIYRLIFAWVFTATTIFFLAYIANRTKILEQPVQILALCGLAGIFVLPFRKFLISNRLWLKQNLVWSFCCCVLGVVIIFVTGLLSSLELLPFEPISISARVLPLSSINSLTSRRMIVVRAYADGLAIVPHSLLSSGWEYQRARTFWETLTGFKTNAKNPAVLEFKATVRNNMTLIFPKNIHGGCVLLESGDISKTLDTFSNSSAWEEVYNDDIFISIQPHLNFSFLWLVLSTVLMIGSICVGGLVIAIGAIVLVRLLQIDVRSVHIKNTNPVILFVLTCLIPFVYWLSFYPGLMSCDSLNVWAEAISHKFSDTQPFFYTLVVSCLTRLWLNPAVISLFNIICFGLAISFAVTMISKQWRLTSVVAYAYVLLWSALPLANFMLITVWKDIPYSICIFWITVLAWLLIKTNGRILFSKRFVLMYILSFILICLFRHNGIAVVVPLAAVLIILLRKKKRLISATLAALFFVLVFKTAALAFLKVTPMVTSLKYLTLLHAFLTLEHDNILQTKDNTVGDVCQFWRHSPPYCFTRFNVLPTAMVLSVDKEYKIDPMKIGEALRYCLVNYPLPLMRTYLDISSVVWNPIQSTGSYTYVIHPGIDENKFGLHSHSKLPFLKKLIDDFVVATSSANINWILWRPAIYLYIVCFFCLVLAMKYNNFSVCVLAVPLIMNSLVIAIFNSGQDVRYLLSNIFVMPFIVLLFVSNSTYQLRQINKR